MEIYVEQFERMTNSNSANIHLRKRKSQTSTKKNNDEIDLKQRFDAKLESVEADISNAEQYEKIVKELQHYILDIKDELIRLQIQQTCHNETNEKVELLQ